MAINTTIGTSGPWTSAVCDGRVDKGILGPVHRASTVMILEEAGKAYLNGVIVGCLGGKGRLVGVYYIDAFEKFADESPAAIAISIEWKGGSKSLMEVELPHGIALSGEFCDQLRAKFALEGGG